MRYELLLQSGAADSPFDVAAVDAALEARGASPRPDGVREWKLPAGEVEARTLSEGGVAKAVELGIPLSDRLELVRELVREAAALAQQAQVKLYDPQLSRTLGPQDEALVAEQYLVTARYAGEMMGLTEAVGASFSPPDEGLKPGTKILLGLLGGALLVYLFVDRLLLP